MRATIAITAAAVLTLGLSTAVQAQEWNELPLADHTYRHQESGYRTDTIDVPLLPFRDLEYKVRMKAGASFVYTWHVVKMAEPDALVSEFHGHTDLDANRRGTVMFYRKAKGGTEQGMLIAPFDGIHGWYLLNQSKESIVVRLTLAGFYELIPEKPPQK